MYKMSVKHVGVQGIRFWLLVLAYFQLSLKTGGAGGLTPRTPCLFMWALPWVAAAVPCWEQGMSNYPHKAEYLPLSLRALLWWCKA